jgi:hypothetical protein
MRKSVFWAVLASIALLGLALGLRALAQQTQVDVYEGGQVKSVVFVVGLKEYFVNGQTPGVKMDAAPFIEEKSGRTFVPIRYLAYGLGVAKKDVGWDGKARKVTLKKGDITAMLTVDRSVMLVNGAPRQMDVSPILKAQEGRTYLPARWVAEALGYEVEWSPDDKLVVCWPKGQPRPDADIAKVKGYVEGLKPVGQVFTKPAGYGEWSAQSKEYRQQQVDVAVELAKKAKPFAGVPWDKSGWKFANSLDFSGSWEFMRLGSVGDLKPNGVNLGDQDPREGIMVILDLWVEGDAVYVKEAGGDYVGGPGACIMWLVEPGNLVRYDVGDPYSYLGNPFIHKYNLKWVCWAADDGIPHMGWADGKVHHIDEFPAFLFSYGCERVLYVPNPAYRGGK